MDQKQPTSNPQGVCEKLFNAFSVNPTFRTFRRISHQPQTPPVVSTPVSAPPPPQHQVSPQPPPPHPVTVDYNASTLGTKTNQTKPNTVGVNEPGKDLGHTSVAPSKSNTAGKNEQGMGSGQTHIAEKTKVVAEAVFPAKTDNQLPQPPTATDEREKLTTTQLPMRAKVKSHVSKVFSKNESTHAPVSNQEKEKPKLDLPLAPQPEMVAKQVKPEVASKPEPLPVPPKQVVTSKVEEAKKTRTNSINEKAADYITRAKSKLRTTTMTGGAGKQTNSK